MNGSFNNEKDHIIDVIDQTLPRTRIENKNWFYKKVPIFRFLKIAKSIFGLL